jgi:hypothetical protein
MSPEISPKVTLSVKVDSLLYTRLVLFTCDLLGLGRPTGPTHMGLGDKYECGRAGVEQLALIEEYDWPNYASSSYLRIVRHVR